MHPRWKLRGLRDKYLLRRLAERWLPQEIAWRRKAMFRAPFDSFHDEHAPPFVDQLLSEESLRRTGYFDAAGGAALAAALQDAARRARCSGSPIEMGLVGVLATQLWHQTFIDGSLADVPAARRSRPVLASCLAARPLGGACSPPAERRLNQETDMSYSLATLWYETNRFLPGVLAVAFSALLIALQCGLLLGLFSITSIPIDHTQGRRLGGRPGGAERGSGPADRRGQHASPRWPSSRRWSGRRFTCRASPTGRSRGGGNELCMVIGSRLGDDSLGSVDSLTPELRSRLTEHGAIVVDESELDRLGINGVGDYAEITGKRVPRRRLDQGDQEPGRALCVLLAVHGSRLPAPERHRHDDLRAGQVPRPGASGAAGAAGCASRTS